MIEGDCRGKPQDELPAASRRPPGKRTRHHRACGGQTRRAARTRQSDRRSRAALRDEAQYRLNRWSVASGSVSFGLQVTARCQLVDALVA